MTDNDIIKALECCSSSTGAEACKGCPFNEKDICDKEADAPQKYALDLINRLQAEIERYKGVIKLLENDVKEAQAELKEFKALYVNKIAEMGIKAFAERLCRDRVSNDPVVIAVKTELKMTEQSTGYGSSKTEGNG